MPEITFIVDELRGAILVEETRDLNRQTIDHLREHLGTGQEIGCARPLEIIKPPTDAFYNAQDVSSVRIAGYYHHSLTEGPGRRSSVLFQFCPLKCKGCWVENLHRADGGISISAVKLAELLLDSNIERDGVSILGGEPFAQPEGLLALVKGLRSKSCPHIVCYSGYTIEVLRENATKQPAINSVLDEIDILIDGPYIESLSDSAGLWTGSGNQRVIDLPATRKRGETVLYQSPPNRFINWLKK